MEQAEEISQWKVRELRDWLDRESINYSKASKKQELVDLVVEAGQRGLVVERIASEADFSKLTIDGLIQWLTERNVELPGTRQKKQFYLDLAEALSQSGESDSPRSASIPEGTQQTTVPSTTPRPSRSTSRKTPSKAKSSSPPARRRSVRRKLLDMPDSASSSNEEDEETTVTAPAQAEIAQVTTCSSSPCRNRIGSMFMLFVIFAVISAYIAYLTKSLIPHLNW